MTRAELDAKLEPHAGHPLAAVCIELFGLMNHWKGWTENLQKRDVDAAMLQKKVDDLEARVWGLQHSLEEARKKVSMPWVPTTAEELVTFLREAGATVFMDDGKPTLRVPPGAIEGETMHRIKPLVKQFRDEVMSGLDQTSDRLCSECRGTFAAAANPDEIFDQCRGLMCPFYRPGHPADSPGYSRQRSYAFWKKGKDAETEKRQEAPIPE